MVAGQRFGIWSRLRDGDFLFRTDCRWHFDTVIQIQECVGKRDEMKPQAGMCVHYACRLPLAVRFNPSLLPSTELDIVFKEDVGYPPQVLIRNNRFSGL
jgi:hypothetical protein